MRPEARQRTQPPCAGSVGPVRRDHSHCAAGAQHTHRLCALLRDLGAAATAQRAVASSFVQGLRVHGRDAKEKGVEQREAKHPGRHEHEQLQPFHRREGQRVR
eukprot:Tamp_31303.p4 GENE.Tamp_31303~~Tamp_31303.p4  ORF type:complete len:103 (-),score=4.41 Tamp_31303:192-500(-)